MSTRDSEREHCLMVALAESVESATDQELLDDAIVQGLNPEAEASAVRDLLLGAVMRVKKERLQEAKREHARRIVQLAQRTARLPADPAARRTLLNNVLQRQPEIKAAVITVQHRDFESFTDADVESALRQLDMLGILDDEDPDSKS